MIKDLVNRAGTALTVWRKKRELTAYVRTLSPAQQAWANDLRARLEAVSPAESAVVLKHEADRLLERSAKVVSRLAALHNRP